MVSRNNPNTQRCQARRPKVCSRKCAASSKSFFPSDNINSVANATGSFERLRKLKPVEFVTTLAFFRGDTIGYEDLAAEIRALGGESISAQAIGDKVKKSDGLFQALTSAAISRSQQLPRSEAITIPGVGNILIADASTIALRKSLAKLLPGTGGSGPVAAAKMHALFNVTTQRFAHLTLTEGKASDHQLVDDHFAVSKAGDLIIRDLGYFEIKDLRRLGDNGRYFISRLPLSLTYFWQDGRLIDPWKWLAASKLKVVDQVLTIGGNDRLTARIVAIRLPRKKWQERLASLRKELGRELTPRDVAQAKWNLIITNLSDTQASADTLAKLYAVRWQIELLFKALKSGLSVDKIRSASCLPVVKAYIWARLLAAALLMTARDLISTKLKNEIGILKWYRRTAAQLPRIRCLIQANRWLALAKWLLELGRRHCLAANHSKPSSREKINKSSKLNQDLWRELYA